MNILGVAESLMKLLGAAAATAVPETASLSTPAARQCLDCFLSAAGRWGEVKLKEFETGRAILEAAEEERIAVVHAALEWMARDRSSVWDGSRLRRWQAVRGLLNQLLARHLRLTRVDLERMLALLVSSIQRQPFGTQSLVGGYASYFPVRRLLHQVELFAASHGI